MTASKQRRTAWTLLIDTLGAGGAQRQLVNLANGLADAGDDVHLAHYRGGDVHYDVDRRVRLSRLAIRGPIVLPWNLIKVRRLLTPGCDAAVAYLPTSSIAAALASMSIRPSRRPLIITSQRGKPAHGLVGTLGRIAHRLGDVTVCNAKSVASQLEELSFAPSHGSMLVIPNGVQATQSERDYRDGEPLRLAITATVNRAKGPIQLAEAVVQSQADCHVRWAGVMSAAFDSASIADEVEACLAGSSSRWEWVGHLDQSAVQELYRWADALVHPSLSEALPNAVCEALESGLPTIVTDVGDTATVLPDSLWPFTSPPDDSAALARAIDEFADTSAPVRRQLGADGRAKIRTELSTDKMVARYRDIVGSGQQWA